MAFISSDLGNLVSVSLLGVLLSLLIGTYLWKYHKQWRRNLPPGVPALPVVGSFPFLRLKGVDDHLRFQELTEKYGNIYSFWLGQKFGVLISGYDLIRTALLDQPVIMAGRPAAELYTSKFTNPKGFGLATPSYHAQGWKKERQVTLAILKDFGFGKNIMQTRIKREVDDLLSHLKNSDGKPQDLRKALTISVSNVICSIVLGKRYPFRNCDELLALLDAMDQEFKTYSKCVVVDFIPIAAYLPSIKKTLKELFGIYRFVQNFLRRVIREHKKAYALDREDDFIDAFIGRMGKEYCSERLMYIVRDLFAAGTETSSTTLQWAVVYMANNPDIQRKVQCEIDQIVGTERLVSLEDKPLLPYTEAVVLEVQRLAVLGPLSVPHMTLGDTELSGYHIPAKSTVFINLWSVLRDPVLWPEPEKFQPERFLDNRGCVVHRSELIPFSLGRRSCLGEAMARQELFLFFCGLVQSFNIRPPHGVDKLDENGTASITRSPLPFEVILSSRT